MKLKITFQKILIISCALFFLSCSKNNPPEQQTNKDKVQQNKKQEEQPVNPDDTNLTPPELFAVTIQSDFLNGNEDEDLGDYFEQELYKYSQNYRGASVNEINESTWLVTLENNQATKNFMLQKFLDFKSNEYYFVLKEVTLTPSELLTICASSRKLDLGPTEQTEVQQQPK